MPARPGDRPRRRGQVRRAAGLRAVAGHAGRGASRDRRDRVTAAPASRHRARRFRRGRPRALREAARHDRRRGARHGGGGGARRAHRHDVLQLALPRRDAALPRHGRSRPRRPALPHRRALARRAVGGGDGARDLAHGSRPGGPWRDGRHGRARDRSPALELRGDRPGDGRRGHRLSVALGARSRPPRGCRGLLHGDRGARLRRPRHVHGEPRGPRRKRADHGVLRQPGRPHATSSIGSGPAGIAGSCRPRRAAPPSPPSRFPQASRSRRERAISSR